MRTLRFLSASTALCLLILPAAAQPIRAEDAAAPAKAEAAKTDALKADEKAPVLQSSPAAPAPGKKVPAFKVDNPYRKEVYDRALALAKKLSDKQSLALAYIKSGYGTIKAVDLVEKNVSAAVTKCGEKNPDLKEDIDGRFQSWQDKIHPALKDNDAKMEKALTGGTFKDKDIVEIRAYLAAIDKAAAHADSEMEKDVLATPDSCHALMESMDKTEDTLAGLLGDIPWTAPAKAEEPAAGEKDSAVSTDPVKAAEDAARAAVTPKAKAADAPAKADDKPAAAEQPETPNTP